MNKLTEIFEKSNDEEKGLIINQLIKICEDDVKYYEEKTFKMSILVIITIIAGFLILILI